MISGHRACQFDLTTLFNCDVNDERSPQTALAVACSPANRAQSHPLAAATVSLRRPATSAAPHGDRDRQRACQSHGVGVPGRVRRLTHRHAAGWRRSFLAQRS